jgi:probable F420-dependent oxidoreductase
MKIGIPLFMIRPTQMAEVAQRAEALGFESVWIPEHLVFPVRLETPYPYSRDGRAPFTPDTPILDPLMLLTHIAAATTRIRLGTNIFVLPLRHPLVVARLAMTLDVLSGGRLCLGVGAGWLEEEFRAVGVDFATRGGRLRECVLALRALWTQEQPEFHGRFFDFGPLKFEPKPVQKPHPPILFGGESPSALRRAAALGDGWYGVAHDPHSAAEHVAKLRALREAAGRAGAPFEVTVGNAGGPLDSEALRRYADAGVDRVCVVPWSRGREAIAKLEELAVVLDRYSASAVLTPASAT